MGNCLINTNVDILDTNRLRIAQSPFNFNNEKPYEIKISEESKPKRKPTDGERQTAECLTSLNIKFQEQYTIPELPRKRYDFYFVVNNKKYLLEYDDEQHFKEKYRNRTRQEFLAQQQRDREKTFIAIQNNYNVIRIDYTEIKNLKEHIMNALKLKDSLYLSNQIMYKYL